MRTELLFSAILAIAAGCGDAQVFNSNSPLGDGVRGKYWGAPSFVDSSIYTALGSTKSTRLLSSFDGVVSGNDFIVTASWLDLGSGAYHGYGGSIFNDGGATPAPALGAIASTGTNNTGFTSLAAGPGGLLLASFLDASSPSLISDVDISGSWQTQKFLYSLGSVGTAHPFDPTADLSAGPPLVSAFDSLGRNFLFWTGSSGNLELSLWQPTNSTGGSAAITITPAIAVRPGITTQFDGVKWVCATYEKSSGALTQYCIDTTRDLSGLPNTFAPSGIATSVLGHESAVSPSGGAIAVAAFMKDSSGAYHVYTQFTSDGHPSGTLQQIDAAMPAGYVALTDSTRVPRPGIAYIGDDAGQDMFIAAWIGVNTATRTTRVFSSTFSRSCADASGNLTQMCWGNAIPVTPEEPYTQTPHDQSIHVFGNGARNAGIAVNRIYVDGGGTYTEAAGYRVLVAARFQLQDGWLPSQVFSNWPCNPGTTVAQCTHRPLGRIFPSGNSVILYEAQDSAGNSRLASVFFQ